MRYRDDSMPFAYAAIAVEGVGWAHPDSLILQLANIVSSFFSDCCVEVVLQLLGSWDRTHGCGANSPSRLAQKVGFGNELQSYQAFVTQYKDTGLWGTYFVCKNDATRDFTKLLQSEWYICICRLLLKESAIAGAICAHRSPRKRCSAARICSKRN